MKRCTLMALVVLAACGTVPDENDAAERPDARQEQGVDPRPPHGAGQRPAFPGQTDAPAHDTKTDVEVIAVARGLEQPWGLAFLPDGRMLVTEKPGRLRLVMPEGRLSGPVSGLPAVDARNQGGLLGLALDPGFQSNGLVYWSYSERSGGANHTSVARGRLVDGTAPRLEDVQVIFRQVPSIASTMHFGSRLVWSRDGTLFITMGDRSINEGRMQAQRLDSLIGKVARINPDGTIPGDNPFAGAQDARPEIWSIGHRNIQAAALHPTTGELWAVEHGARGGDELNVVRRGRDYGWPTIAYGVEYSGRPIPGGITQRARMEQPAYYWDPVIAPSGMAFYTGDLFPAWKGSIFVGGLVSRHLVRLTLDGDKVTGEERLLRELGERIRDVVQGPDEALYVLTDDRNGRVLKLVPRGR